tara:strand:- start:70 stop:357 length:288 start_codon:yes stop_codon:yes gene_type:complete
MANFSTRLSKLEIKYVTPMPVHIIMKKPQMQSDIEAFEDYRAKRTAEGYTPQEGWEQLRATFLSDAHIDQTRFIIFEVMDSVGPRPPVITNHKEV